MPSVITRGPVVPFERISASSAFCAAVSAGISESIAGPTTCAARPSASLWRPRIGSTVKPSKVSTSPPLPVTVLIWRAGSDCVASFSVVTGAPTTIAPVCRPIAAASDM